MSHLNRVRHRSLRVSTKDKTSGTTSRATYKLGTVAFPNAHSISLESLAIPQMIPNVYSGNCDFIYYLSQTFNTTAGVNDQIDVQDLVTGIIYNVPVGTITGSPATFVADINTIVGAVNGALPSTIIALTEDPSPPANSQPRLRVNIAGGGNPIKFLSSSTMGLQLGVYTSDSVDIDDSLSGYLLPNPYGGELVKIESFNYNINELIDVLEQKLTPLLPGSITIEKNSTINPTQSYDERLVITYTPSTTETFYVGSQLDGSLLSPVLGYSGDFSTSIPKAPALFQLFGVKEIYIHCRQTNQQKTQLTDEGKLVSIHACIPVTVGFGSLLTFTAPHHDFFRIRLQQNSNQMKSFTFTLRDVRGNVLTELDPYEYSMSLDVDIVEK